MKQLLILVITLMLGVCSANCYAAPAVSSKPQTEKVNPKTDQNPIVGEVTVSGKAYKVRKGAKGGLYYWKQKASGEHKGEWYKVYVKAEKLQKK